VSRTEITEEERVISDIRGKLDLWWKIVRGKWEEIKEKAANGCVASPHATVNIVNLLIEMTGDRITASVNGSDIGGISQLIYRRDFDISEIPRLTKEVMGEIEKAHVRVDDQIAKRRESWPIILESIKHDLAEWTLTHHEKEKP